MAYAPAILIGRSQKWTVRHSLDEVLSSPREKKDDDDEHDDGDTHDDSVVACDSTTSLLDSAHILVVSPLLSILTFAVMDTLNPKPQTLNPKL